MNCPGCSGDLETWRQDNVTHDYCPSCQPRYRDPPTKTQAAVTLLFIALSIPLYPPAYLYLRSKGEL